MWLEPLQVAGAHNGIYEAYYQQVDPNGTGAIQALDAARFLKKSRLSDVILSKIWDLSDPTGKGYLDKAGLFVSLKLVALAQAGRDISMNNIHSDAPVPKIGEVPAPVVPRGGSAAGAAPVIDWSMKPAERDKYNQLFDSLQPNNGLIAGNKVKGVLMESKLPLKTLGQIWDLADQDKDGMLDRHEFCVAMHLVYKALEKYAVPTSLPAELRRAAPPRPASRPPSRPASRPASPRPAPPRPTPPPTNNSTSNASLLDGLLDLSSPPTQTAPPLVAPPSSAAPPTSDHYLTPTEKVTYTALFTAADVDRDGYVSGAEIKDTFLKSGLPQRTLADIWALCDRNSVGKLDCSQFCMAMWMLQRAAAGVPPALPPPPPPLQLHQPPPVGDPIPSLGPQPTPELEAIAREVEALARERRALELEVNGKEKEMTVKTSEADSLQRELDTLTATLKQLENQKGEAQKRLNDLKTQVDKLRAQVQVQESAAAETERDVMSRRSLIQTQQAQADELRAQLHQAQADEETLTNRCRKAVLALSQIRIKLSHLEEQHGVLSAAVETLTSSTSVDAALLTLQPNHTREHLDRLVQGDHISPEESKPASRNEFGTMNGSFTSDPFKDNSFTHDPFAPSSHNNKSAAGGFSSDPFASDPFAGDSFTNTTNTATTKNDGAWEADPFAVLHAPTRESAGAGAAAAGAAGSPALPPKANKAPPPRPAPPRPAPPSKPRATTAMDFTEDPFKDYRYEDPFNIEDPFDDVTDSKRIDPFAARPTSVVGFETDDFFSTTTNLNGSFAPPEKRSGRVSAPPVAYDPFSANSNHKSTPNSSANNDSWAAWPNDNWTDDAWAKPRTTNDAWPKTTNQKIKSASQNLTTDAWSSSTKTSSSDWKTDNWADKTDNWATDWGGDHNKNLNETWPSNTLPGKKEKSPKPVKYAKSLVNTIGGIGRTRQNKDKKNKNQSLEARSVEFLPTEEQQWAWAAAESKRSADEAEKRRKQEDAELQLALAISRQEK